MVTDDSIFNVAILPQRTEHNVNGSRDKTRHILSWD